MSDDTAAHVRRMEAEDREPDGTHRDWFRMVDFVRYDYHTGAILASGHMALAAIRHEDALYENDGYLIAKGSADTHWVYLPHGVRDAARLMPKTRCPARIDGMRLLYLPVPCTITVTDEGGDASEHVCDDGIAEFDELMPGRYTVRVESVKHLSGSYVIEVSA